jgi:DNA-binding response OmpR family regulator
MATRRILLVEDDKELSTLLSHVLVTAGFDVDLVRTVGKAQERLTGSAYELVIADWRLPDGDGLDIADRAADLGIKAAVLTGYAFRMPAEKAARHEVWMKPMRPKELIAAVERCLGREADSRS